MRSRSMSLLKRFLMRQYTGSCRQELAVAPCPCDGDADYSGAACTCVGHYEKWIGWVSGHTREGSWCGVRNEVSCRERRSSHCYQRRVLTTLRTCHCNGRGRNLCNGYRGSLQECGSSITACVVPADPEPEVACISTIPIADAEITTTIAMVAAAGLIPNFPRPDRLGKVASNSTRQKITIYGLRSDLEKNPID